MNEYARIEIPCNSCGSIVMLRVCGLENDFGERNFVWFTIKVMNEDMRIEIPYNACGPTVMLTMCDLANGLQWQGFCVVDP